MWMMTCKPYLGYGLTVCFVLFPLFRLLYFVLQYLVEKLLLLGQLRFLKEGMKGSNHRWHLCWLDWGRTLSVCRHLWGCQKQGLPANLIFYLSWRVGSRGNWILTLFLKISLSIVVQSKLFDECWNWPEFWTEFHFCTVLCCDSVGKEVVLFHNFPVEICSLFRKLGTKLWCRKYFAGVIHDIMHLCNDIAWPFQI